MHDVKGPDGMDEMEERFAELVGLYQTPLRRMCCVWLRDASVAEDAVQEMFLRAYRALPAFRGECSGKTWLYRIAVNVCRNMKRSWWWRHVDRAVEISNLPETSVPAAVRVTGSSPLFNQRWGWQEKVISSSASLSVYIGSNLIASTNRAMRYSYG